MSCDGQGKGAGKAQLPTKGEIDTVSYLIGVNYGMMIKGQIAESLSDLNMAQVKKGMEDALKATDPKGYGDTTFMKQFKVDLNQANMIINSFVDKKTAYKAAITLKEGQDFLANNAKKAGVDTTASGLQYKIENAGGDYKVMPQDTVEVKYKGTLLDGTVFDETTGDETRTFNANRVIKGWTEGLGLLGEGGKATFYIPSELAYGERGTRGIAPNSVLIFDVEVVRIGKAAENTEE
ncbi:MAG: FKBP-type peptidyl-prolyl cis-trans isomerase [Bacteroidales bacterium]|nr:FKBP-type peptidyl-prolyl cis-trans isomerase [Bacteroidales bacterium]MDE5956523.1 FKBP-type peptidyl-prolyl cis-trans isomerase [Bacteroidales bacterium]MDE6147340.1 FKBP-type peptidyl-prolyl cis-trans isomerase [Bacteroidales bacterium]